MSLTWNASTIHDFSYRDSRPALVSSVSVCVCACTCVIFLFFSNFVQNLGLYVPLVYTSERVSSCSYIVEIKENKLETRGREGSIDRSDGSMGLVASVVET